MGAAMSEPVTSTIVVRHRTKGFNVGVAEMNGWRTNMEDAHLVITHEDWGFFGVFDGHCGEECSKFVAGRLRDELEAKGCPTDDNEVKRLMLDVDQEFIDSEIPGGCTAAMCIVRKPHQKEERHQLHVINIGDSRVLLGHSDGTIVDGGGTDAGLTTDHKPDLPSESERIIRCGGRVESFEGGDARVNGELAVSRCFGDREYKKTGGPGPENRPVTANPEMGHFKCGEADFLLLVCDGVSEGNFPNADVVKLVAKLLREGKDPGTAAQIVCQTALDRDSKDNITCIVVCFKNADSTDMNIEFVPGPVICLQEKDFRNAYAAMAEKAGFTLAQAVEKRYETVQAKLTAGSLQSEVLCKELAMIGTPDDVCGSCKRAQWFEKWVYKLSGGKRIWCWSLLGCDACYPWLGENNWLI